MNNSSLLDRIDKYKDSFSKTEKEISTYLCSHLDEFIALTIQELSEETGCSEATIIRYSKKLGYSGYQELKKELKHNFSNKFSPSKRIERFYKKNEENNYDKFIDEQISYINKIKEIDYNSISKLIIDSNKVFLYSAGGASSSPMSTFDFWLSRYGLDVECLIDSGHRLFDKLVHAKKEDILFAYNFGKENIDLVKLLEFCNSQEIKSILITDFAFGSSAKLATTVINVQRGPLEFFHSMSIPVLFTECLALEIAKNKGDVFSNMKKLEEVRELFNV